MRKTFGHKLREHLEKQGELIYFKQEYRNKIVNGEKKNYTLYSYCFKGKQMQYKIKWSKKRTPKK